MSTRNLTGKQRGRILMLALQKHSADDIAHKVGVSAMAVRELCRGAGVALAEREDYICEDVSNE